VSNPLDLNGRTAIVTGGTKGLGRVIATTLLEHGAEVIVCARNAPETPVSAGGREAHFVAADVRDAEQVGSVVDAAVERTGRVDILVNNAGGAPPAESATVSPRFNEKIVALNLLAPMLFSQAVHDIMQAQEDGGVIVNIASVSGTRANPKGVAYGAAKAGLNALTESFAWAFGPKVRVNAIAAGPFLTDISKAWDMEAFSARAASTIPLQRGGEPEEIVGAALYFASAASSYTTGTVLRVDGGSRTG